MKVDPDLIVVMSAAVISIIPLGGFALVGWRMWLRRPGVVDSDKLTQSQRDKIRDAVRDEVAELLAGRDGELDDLSERIDFAERLLIRARASEGHLEREPTPV